jgi:signal transduction histidine kinase/DNA-binding response OmpR family regulator
LKVLTQGLIVMLVTLGLIVIVRQTLTRHLETLANYIKRLNFDALIAPLKLKRRTPRRPDELSEVEQALNTMRLQLLAEARDMQASSNQSRGERDEAVRANHAKNLFLANVSHELRTPLQSVLGYSTLLDDTPLDDEQKEYVQTLQNAAENLSAIINDLLDISSMEAGKLILEDIPFDLRDNLNDLVVMLGGRAREKGLALELQIDENLPAALRGDPIRFRQVLLNLTANAIKFTDSGHVLVSLDVIGREAESIRIRVAIEDTGVGIHRDDLALIYEPYLQLGQRVRHQVPGAGLGLTICRQLVHLMGGKLDVQSQPGQGSTFWLELDLPLAPEGTTRVRPDTRMIQGRRILVVDSYALSCKITLEMLSRYDMEIEAVKSAAEAILTLRQSTESDAPFDAVILDGFIPDMDSDLLCEQIRHNSQWRSIRLLVLSSNPQRGDAEHFRQAGADGFLSKSLRESCLPPMLHQLFLDRDAAERHFITRFSLQSQRGEEKRRPLPCERMRVLLVEDNPVNRTLTKRLLEKLGNDVTTANDGEAALSLLRWNRFDLVFMDCIMPRVDGFEATRQLRQWERERSLASIPVIALTASAMEQDEQRCQEAGMNAFVAKPVNLDRLRDVLEQFCQSAVDA